ncbi:radiation sensitive protein rad9 [Didymosphaeria variabile]|uniref:Radiation sensitive protein rad9 n=1 Tax=Didymosphaeria variabile TaxID=1932322 RepID=A0A9W8XBV6_9PLEO|nr:radiation sensitive protein rad9 [Didymosphaeria variabile]KAJ4346630.1 radiation sensitive protein rad9 [Didymosphaeria variabile]
MHTGPLIMENEETRKPYQSFNGTMDAPGDTQVDPEIYKMLTSGIYPSNSTLGAAFEPVVPYAEHGSSESADNYIAASSQEPPRDRITSPVTINDDQDTQNRAHYAETSPLKLLETPAAYTGRKRDSQGQVLSSVGRTNTTPGTVLSASAFFSFRGDEYANGMSLTQAFNATQAKTSPAVGNPNDDVVFQRPSPNFTHARHSSADAMLSSPIKPQNRKEPVGDIVLRSSSEPRADYESMKHSQERRSRERASEEKDIEEQQDSWEQPTGVGKHYARRKAKERFEQEAAKSLAGVSAPTSSARLPKKRGLLSMRATTTSPRKPTRTELTVYHGPYDGAGADAPYELSQHLTRNDDTGHSPDELPQDLFTHRSAPAIAMQVVGAEQRVQVPHTSSHPVHTYSAPSSHNLSQPNLSPSQPQPESQIRASASQPAPKSLSRLRSSRETEVVMDSQPEPAATFRASQPAPLRYPSSPSTNAYSINQTTMLPKSALISSPISSAIPMPPKFSSQELGVTIDKEDTGDVVEEGVPSSPPLIVRADGDDDITYDEHAYEDDSNDGCRERDGQSGADDAEMEEADEGDDLPTPEDEPSEYALSDSEDEPENRERVDDDEVPETIEQEHGQDALVGSGHPPDGKEESTNTPMAPPRTHRQSTVPETDMLEETQPSLIPEAADATQLDTTAAATENVSTGILDNDQNEQIDHGQSNSNERFDTAKEHQSTSQVANEVSSAIEETVAAPSPARFKGRSLLDIANESGTQQSVDFDGLDLPQLSFDGDPEDALDAMIARDSPYHTQKKRRTTYSTKKAFRSPIKDTDPVSDQLSSSPQPRASHAPGWSPPTTQDREAQGAQAAARARKEAGIQSATLKSKTRFKPNQPQTPRKGALKTVNKTLLSKSPGQTPPKALPKDRTAEHATPTRSLEARSADVEMGDIDHLDAEDEPVQDANIASIEHVDVSTADDFVEDPSGERNMPNRIFAFWPKIGYCPATCIGRVDSHRLRVRYDDGTINVLEHMQIRALDLHPADQIKIDIPGKKKSAYVVVGFKNKVDPQDPTLEYPATNRHGHATVVLEEKQRDSLPAHAQARARDHIDVPIANIYLTTQLWARLRDRTFEYDKAASPAAPASRVGTPRTVESAIPMSTSLRRSAAGPSFLRDSAARASSVASSARSSGNVFLNMAFAVTSTSTTVNKDDISKLITSSGGLVVDEGFHELFDRDSYDAPMSSAGSQNAPSASMHGLKLKSKNEDLRFVALIAQSHSRSPKFLQALSLNIPCLHLRWIHDSLAVGCALPFAKYLLPAGTSTFLDPVGVVRSRNLPTYDPTAEDTTFAQMVKDRELLFRNESVLIVSEENEQEPYIFLTHAMGATEVCLCSDLEEAKESVDTGAWDWVYVDGKPDALADAAAQIFGIGAGKTAGKKATKKRKRDSESAKAPWTGNARTHGICRREEGQGGVW